jgi:SSS family solute:Na+ symporter
MFGFRPLQTILVASPSLSSSARSAVLRAVLLTDFLLFIVAMIGAVAAAVVALNHPDVGGLTGLLASPRTRGKLTLIPPAAPRPPAPAISTSCTAILIIPLAVQWWSVWYPGSEPGGGGYVAQRMLSARTEKKTPSAPRCSSMPPTTPYGRGRGSSSPCVR